MTTSTNSSIVRIAFALAALGLAGAGCKPKATTTPEPVVTPEPVAKPEPKPEPVVEKPPAKVYPEPPAPGAAKPVNFPVAATFALPNGLQVYVVENHEVPVVAVELTVRAGSMDSEHAAGFVASMLGEGTKTRTKAKIDESIEFVGANISGSAGAHTSGLATRVLKPDLKLALTLMADETMNPVFPEDALAKLKTAAKTGLSVAKSQPGQLAAVLFDMVAYPEGHPYGRPFATDAEIDAVTVAELVKFHETFYRSNNAYLILSGDITQKEAEPLVKRAFGAWKPVPKDAALPPNPLNQYKSYELPKELTVHLVDRPGSAQSEIIVGNLAIARNHPDWAAMQVANNILGDDANGRLFTDIREKRGLTYGIYSRVDEGQAPGTFSITTRTRTKSTGEMLAAIFEHLKRMRNEAPSQEEFDSVVKKMVGSFPLEIETADQIAGRLDEALTYELPLDYWRTYRDQLAGVDMAAVQRVAKDYIHPIPHVVVVGRADKVEKQIQQVFPKAKIVKYDGELHRVQ
ncbi:MAG: insulinase family protein [Nannocystaceae bacterium]|nr:insulinase family protein [Nannocystaceae bacterium]